jgi:hypothetical protein
MGGKLVRTIGMVRARVKIGLMYGDAPLLSGKWPTSLGIGKVQRFWLWPKSHRSSLFQQTREVRLTVKR